MDESLGELSKVCQRDTPYPILPYLELYTCILNSYMDQTWDLSVTSTEVTSETHRPIPSDCFVFF